ncbi:hypothetical protein DY000_02004380 [Brassica cretica]|uniref:Uncharacterized protein n=1 Tax=Brassica cretica TaxID=69181 RepID=A0ABQ7CBH8_BRACR|nr:hypothetical protein DY000_02004380 [Brassica cretica]
MFGASLYSSMFSSSSVHSITVKILNLFVIERAAREREELHGERKNIVATLLLMYYVSRESCDIRSQEMTLVCVAGWKAGSMRWMGDGAILSVRMKTGWIDSEDGQLAVLFNPI